MTNVHRDMFGKSIPTAEQVAEKLRLARNARACELRQNLKRMVLSHYSGGGKPRCVNHPQLTDPDVLTIGHVNHDGAPHRRTIGGSIYAWLKREGYPAGYRAECWNCNTGGFIKRRREGHRA